MKRIISIFVLFTSLSSYAQTLPPLDQKGLVSIHDYITHSWDGLRRSVYECKSLRDELTQSNTLLYLPAGFIIPEQVLALKQLCQVDIKSLPTKINSIGTIKPKNLPMGLLYLPKPYIVPGGMFNEMYGWDSYFIMLGLLADHKLDYADDMLENILFEIQHYGGILNANRSYYLTRSQPPFLTSMIRAVYEANPDRPNKTQWLANAYKYAAKDYRFWTSGSHLAGSTGLSRYYDFDSGPVPELNLPGNHYYADAAQELNTTLNNHFYAGDRAMRESGLDTTFRFGPFSSHTTDYAPVDLNSLLYKSEQDLAWISEQLKRPAEAAQWHNKAAERLKRMNQYLWDEKQGLYFDYNFRNHKRSGYQYISTLYPLWAQAASQDQAKEVVKHLEVFERDGGLLASPYQTGAQWDAPYGWAPHQYLSVKGLSNYHYDVEANRIAYKYIKMVLNNFTAEHTVHEKYDVIHASSSTNIKFGYTNNVVGFGWTNGVFLALLNDSIGMEKH